MSMIVPTLNFSYTEMQKLYRFNTVTPSSEGFYVIPASPFQGHGIFLLPRELPVVDLERRIPYDMLASLPEDIIAEIIQQLTIEEIFDDTYQIQARFVEYLPNLISVTGTTKPTHIIKPAHPLEATHIQITGSRDVYFPGGIMCPPTPIEERLNSIATRKFFTPEAIQGLLYVEWLIPCDFRTNKVRRKWAAENPYYK